MKLVAFTTGFYKGERIRAGREFEYLGPADRLPKWAGKPGEKPPSTKARDADLRPKAAQMASKAKASGGASDS